MNIIQKIKAAIALQRAVNNAAKEIKTMKPGWKTTEFWGKVFVQAWTVWGAVHGFIDPALAVKISAIAEGAYGLYRTVVKSFNGTELPVLPQ